MGATKAAESGNIKKFEIYSNSGEPIDLTGAGVLTELVYYESILEVKEYLKAFNDEEVLNDEEIASAYRDNLRQIIEYNAAFIGRCEEVECLDYLVLNEKIE